MASRPCCATSACWSERMRVLVVGAGVIGVTTAHELARRGHDVTVLDRAYEPGRGASDVNAGLLVPGDALAWGTPKAPLLMLDAVMGRSRFLRVRRGAGGAIVPWGLRFLRECRPARAIANVAALHALCAFSYAELERLLAEERIDASHARNGMLFLFATREGLVEGAAARRMLARLGETYDELTPADLVGLDGAYERAAGRVAGALLARGSGHGDCGAFTRALAERCRALGVTFTLGAGAERLLTERSRVVGAMTSAGPLRAELTVVAAGTWSAALARTAGPRLPIVPSKGYCLTIPPRVGARIPTIGGVDEDAHVAFSPMDGRLRMSSTAEFAGFSAATRPSDFASIRAAATALFGDALDLDAATPGTGFRPSTPSGTPLIGPLRPGLAVNAGHGHLGWTAAVGSARLLADHLDGRRPPIDASPYLP